MAIFSLLHRALLAGSFLFSLLPMAARAHTGEVVLQKSGADMRLTVMAAPVPLRAGPAEFHILVQDSASDDSMLNATVSVELTRTDATPVSEADIWQGGSCCPVTVDGIPSSILALAQREDSRNRLFYTASISLPASGKWALSVAVTTASAQRLVAETKLLVQRPLSDLENYLVWWLIPPVGIGLFAANRCLRRSRSKSL